MLELGYAKDVKKEYYRPNNNGNLAEFEHITSYKAVLTMSRILDGSRVATLSVVMSTPFTGVDFSQCSGSKYEPTKVPMSEFEIEIGFHDVPIEQEGRSFSNVELGVEIEVVEDDLIDSVYEQSDDEKVRDLRGVILNSTLIVTWLILCSRLVCYFHLLILLGMP
ncbi:LOW QUALITY PROTEIN: hypothetical protein TorRG33x02_118590 [Trema orientale]|uniref:Uncharacterized protein n=1 Tax=Trema orientale TaxID=63057 RepID=A0A2P5F3J4_TREOI|nr:LOW QUALITY PROTEIN: hypothetical protein TorRG33x02_118590 [Trema orientale]